jgi:hypothetical protein
MIRCFPSIAEEEAASHPFMASLKVVEVASFHPLEMVT